MCSRTDFENQISKKPGKKVRYINVLRTQILFRAFLLSHWEFTHTLTLTLAGHTVNALVDSETHR